MQLFLIILGLVSLPSTVLAGRSRNVHNTPIVCNNEPDQSLTVVESRRRLRRQAERNNEPILDSPLYKRDLSKRSGAVAYDANCDDAPPSNSRYKPDNGFPTMKSVLQAAYADAVKLAETASNIDSRSPA